MTKPTGLRPQALACLIMIGVAGVACAHTRALLSPLFGDHAVLQRGHPIRVWGTAQAGARVSVSLDGHEAHTRAEASGHWQAILPALKAGGPYVLSARSGERSQSATDIRVGDVFLCSGQSNMVLAVRFADRAFEEIPNSTDPSLRLIQIPHAISAAPRARLAHPAAWQVAGPATVPDWSATCYYFARNLQKTVHVPIGLVQSAWDGSQIQPWLSIAALRANGHYDTGLDVLALYAKNPATAQQAFARQWEKWWRAESGGRGGTPWSTSANGGWRDVPLPLRDWRLWGVPRLRHFTGQVWLRTTFPLTAAQAKRPVTLNLGPINQIDELWINGRPIANTFGYNAVRTYHLEPNALRAGENQVVLAVLDTYGPGGLLRWSSPRSLSRADGTHFTLRHWRYRIVPTSYGNPPQAPWQPVDGLATIYNAMIAPLARLGLRGVVWYQGESNTGDPHGYRVLLTGLMSAWRHQFGASLPFLIVQLPDYGRRATQPVVSSGWADVREAQRKAVLADAHAALAVTVDIGEPGNLHPGDKQDVGARLARAARHLIYGNPMPPSGPVPIRATSGPHRVTLTFADVVGGLVAYSNPHPIGFELCAATPASCTFVSARIAGSRVMLSVPHGMSASRVRYCWGDAPVCTLYDRSGLPAGPFELGLDPSNRP